MRFTPPALGLSLILTLSASALLGQGKPPEPRPANPRSVAMVVQGDSARNSGALARAMDLYESALAVDPANVQAVIGLARTAQRQNMPGKALRYYREALAMEPGNISAIAGQGEAFATRGAIARANENLARLKTLCKGRCAEQSALAQAISRAQLAARSPNPAPPTTQAKGQN